ncbi:unnamed protein product [Fusarium graminearum]|nr:hypothetical protein FGRA07_07646 [Fusarium graminearum]CAF3628543.1 unnamed protein product [Fusarium graminearum]
MNFLRRFTPLRSFSRTFTTTRAIMSKLYVGNLSWNTTDETLRQTFSEFGEVTDSIIMRDRDTGRARGFGFVTFSTEEQATAAVDALNEQDYGGGDRSYGGGDRGGY